MEEIFIQFLKDLKEGVVKWPRIADREHYFAIIRDEKHTYKLIRTTKISGETWCVPCYRTFHNIVADKIIAVHNHPRQGLYYAQPSKGDLDVIKIKPFQNKAKIYYAVITADFYGCFYNQFEVKQYDQSGHINTLERMPYSNSFEAHDVVFWSI